MRTSAVICSWLITACLWAAGAGRAAAEMIEFAVLDEFVPSGYVWIAKGLGGHYAMQVAVRGEPQDWIRVEEYVCWAASSEEEARAYVRELTVNAEVGRRIGWFGGFSEGHILSSGRMGIANFAKVVIRDRALVMEMSLYGRPVQTGARPIIPGKPQTSENINTVIRECPTVEELANQARPWFHAAEQTAAKANLFLDARQRTEKSGGWFEKGEDSGPLFENNKDGTIPPGTVGVASGVAGVIGLLTALGFLKSSGVGAAEAIAYATELSGKPQGQWAEGKQWDDRWGWVSEEQKVWLEQHQARKDGLWVEGTPLVDGLRNAKGQYYSDFWKGWVPADQYQQTRQQLALGRKWDDRWGWVNDAELSERQGNLQHMLEHSQGQSADVRQAHEAWLQSKSKLGEIREEIRKTDRMLELIDEVYRREMEALHRTDSDYWHDVYKFYEGNINQELDALPGQLYGAARNAFRTGGLALRATREFLTDPITWQSVGKATLQTCSDLLTHPVDSSTKVVKFYDQAARVTNKIAMEVIKHPVATVKMVTGITSFEHALDYRIPLNQRLGHALMGAMDSSFCLSGLGLTKPAALFDAAKDAKAAAGLLDKTTDALQAGKLGDGAHDLERLRHWELAEQEGKKRVVEFAEAVKKGDKKAIREAALELQGDKRALQHINKRHPELLKQCGVDDADDLIRGFNKEMGDVYRKTDDMTLAEIKRKAQMEGNPIDDIELVTATNRSDVIKAGADRDVTVRITRNGRTTDYPAKELQEIYDRNFLRASKGDDYVRGLSNEALEREASQFARKLDQSMVDRHSAEAYGRGPGDLKVALSEPGKNFADVQSVGKTIGYKGHEWFGKAADLRASGKVVEAEKYIAEGMRQVSKQYQNQVLPRFKVLWEARVPGLKPIPDRLRQGVELLKQVEAGASPVAVERALQQLGLTPNSLATQLGEYVEAMQKLRPSGGAFDAGKLLSGLKYGKDIAIIGSGG